ncbi:MAG TPA: hypothetical protein ENI23_08245 [bacterium]|nr:hypothetical protein [bacterium]
MHEMLGLIAFLLFVVSFLLVIIGWRMKAVLKELLEKKKTHFPYAYLEHARTEKSYETGSNANYWLLLAMISLLSDEEF